MIFIFKIFITFVLIFGWFCMEEYYENRNRYNKVFCTAVWSFFFVLAVILTWTT